MSTTLYEAVIGLEIHVQLRTSTKMFCGDAVEYGATPNTRVCPVCLALPGALPTINARAVELGARAALGLSCTVQTRSAFVRKHYFYPDLPKGYQITQHDRPLARDGFLVAPVPGGGKACVRIRRVHLEEDTGKSLHDRVEGATAIDLNRAGIPLIEIVTEPDLCSPVHARAFLNRLKQTLEYLDVSDCSMEEGSLRVDANVSVRPSGEDRVGARTEIKNLNSFSGVERALSFEIARQTEVLREDGIVQAQTLLWDAARGEARPMRAKEESPDYRYLPEPDLPALELTPEWIDRIRGRLPELPTHRAVRLQRDYGISSEHAEQLTSIRMLADYFEAVVRQRAEPREVAHWVMGDVLAALNARGERLRSFRIPPDDLATLLRLLTEGSISRPAAKEVFRIMLATGRSAPKIIEEEGLEQVRDRDDLLRWIAEVLEENVTEVQRFRAGESRLMGFFIGEVMRRSRSRADPREVSHALKEALS